MPLDPDARAIIERVQAAGIAPWHTQEIIPARKVYEERAAMLTANAIPVANVRDLQIPGPDTELRARLYHPSPGETLPVLLYLHGGGWVLGSIDSHGQVCRELAVVTGAAVVSLDYRLAPEHPHPAAVEDAYAALSWLSTNAADIGCDPSRLAVGGDSAGGQLTAGLALLARDRGGPRFAAQVLIYPAVEPRFETASAIANATGYLLTTADVIWFWGHYLGGQKPDAYAAPLTAEDHSTLPPALVITAEYDPIRDDGRDYAARLASVGVNVELAEYTGVPHGFVALPGGLAKGRQAVDRIRGWLGRAWA